MVSTQTNRLPTEAPLGDVAEAQYERWKHWPVNWTAVWVGTLASIAMVTIFALIAVAVGAQLLGPENRVVDLHKLSIGALIFSVCGAFFAFVIGGWVAGKIAGILRAEPAMLHGAIVWLVALPLLLVLMAVGAGSVLGGWYGGFSGAPTWGTPAAAPFERPDPIAPTATAGERAGYEAELAAYHEKVAQWKEETPCATRNSALGALTALLIGLIGSVIGGWIASGEPMTFTHHRTRRVPVRATT